jgi:deferrochelatase/peroxidase EfeB
VKAASSGVSRRGMLSGALWAGVGAAGGGAAGWAQASSTHSDNNDKDTVDLHRSYPFYGQPHPAGVATDPQRYCVFMSFTLAPGASRQDLQTLLARWSAASAVLQQGNPVGTVQPASAVAPAADTGEAFGLSPASLTVTIGLGPSVFGERFGLAARKPALLAELPTLNGDNLDPGLTGGDLSIQACADDPQVCYHATRNLARIGRRIVTPSWAVLGFGRASAGPGQETPRNLLGFKDGRATSAPKSSTPSSFGSPTAINRG